MHGRSVIDHALNTFDYYNESRAVIVPEFVMFFNLFYSFYLVYDANIRGLTDLQDVSVLRVRPGKMPSLQC